MVRPTLLSSSMGDDVPILRKCSKSPPTKSNPSSLPVNLGYSCGWVGGSGLYIRVEQTADEEDEAIGEAMTPLD
jgi:hypothetical protein